MKLIYIYLSKKGCLDYTLATIKKDIRAEPIIFISKSNASLFEANFPSLDLRHIDLHQTKIELVLGVFKFKNIFFRLLAELHYENIKAKFVLTAFHPYNYLILKWLNGTNFIASVTIHEFITHTGERSLLIEAIQAQCIKLADEVLFLSSYVKEQASSKLGSHDKFHLAQHPLIKLGIKNSLPYNKSPSVLFLGRIVAYKGVDLLIKACRDLPIQQLTIAGQNFGVRIPEGQKLKIIAKHLSPQEIDELIGVHEILVLPYLEASQSGIISLGIAAEMVMVITKVGGLQEQLSSSSAIWVEPNQNSLRSGILALIENKDLYDSIKKNIRTEKAQACDEVSNSR